MKWKLALAALVAALTLSCASTQTTPDAGPGPAPPAAVEVASILTPALAGGEAAAEVGVMFAAAQGQKPRCYVFAGLSALLHSASGWTAAVGASGEWLSDLPPVKVEVGRCNPDGFAPVLTDQTQATVEAIVSIAVPPLVGLAKGLLADADLPCRWRSLLGGLLTEFEALAPEVVRVMGHPGDAFILPAVPLAACPAEAPAPADVSP